MRTRHRIPSIFNMSMVDVLCCALGCIILLWLVKARDAGTTRTQLSEAEKKIQHQKKVHDDLLRQLAALKRLYASLEGTLALREGEKNKLEDLLAAVRKKLAAAESGLSLRMQEKRLLEDDLASLKKKNTVAVARLAKLNQDHLTLLKELAGLKTTSAADKETLRKKELALGDLEKALAAVRKLAAETQASLRQKSRALTDLEKLAQALRTEKIDLDKRLLAALASARKLRSQSADLRTKLSLADARLLILDKDLADRKKDLAAMGQNLDDTRRKLLRELDDARASIAGLRRDKQALAGQVARVQAAAENRFEGIALTGKRVIFLVDMSGSMELVDLKTPAPQKWSGVRATVAKIMRSLPDLEKFQVIVFSEKASYLLGNADRWIDFDPKTSADRVFKALAAIKPTGGTNMYISFESAFSFRRSGLDTIYVLSDGLPNMGEGLTEEDARRLNENQQAEVLSKYIRNKLKDDWNRPIRAKRVKINTIGFFFESPDVGAFLWALARENDGSFVGMSKP
jgi:septal ring factor EnvC (AmiA/AmiB activator)